MCVCACVCVCEWSAPSELTAIDHCCSKFDNEGGDMTASCCRGVDVGDGETTLDHTAIQLSLDVLHGLHRRETEGLTRHLDIC